MTPADRSLSDVFQDIIRNVQEIVRSEIRLAKLEIGEEASKAAASSLMLGAGIVAGVFATLFLLWTLVYGLALYMPLWAAALIVGGALALIASVMVTTGIRQFKRIHPTPTRTVGTFKENVEWAKQQTK
jgi:uncharacterized membrane protein YqjE